MINTAIVGYGYAGRAFHCYLVGLADGLALHGVSTRNDERRAAAAKDWGVKTYAGVDEMLADGDVQLVVIATPHDTHKDLAVQCMDAGRHVVVDKIMCMNAAEAGEMLAARDRNGVMLSVFQNRRWDWDYSTVRQIIESGEIGEPYYFESGILRYGRPGRWRAEKSRSGGILYDWPAHFVDQMLQLVPARIDRVTCEIQYRGWEIDIGSYARLLCHFENDVLFQIEVGNLAVVEKPRWTVLGEKGGIVKYGLDPQEGPMREGNIDGAEEMPEHRARVFTMDGRERKERVVDSVRSSWKSYYQNISDVLNSGAELAVKPEETRRGMLVYDSAMKSAETGQTITVLI